MAGAAEALEIEGVEPRSTLSERDLVIHLGGWFPFADLTHRIAHNYKKPRLLPNRIVSPLGRRTALREQEAAGRMPRAGRLVPAARYRTWLARLIRHNRRMAE